MSEGTIPSGNIEPQPLTKTVLDNTPSVLVDDTSHLVDDTVALTGSQTTAIGTIRLSTHADSPSGRASQFAARFNVTGQPPSGRIIQRR